MYIDVHWWEMNEQFLCRETIQIRFFCYNYKISKMNQNKILPNCQFEELLTVVLVVIVGVVVCKSFVTQVHIIMLQDSTFNQWIFIFGKRSFNSFILSIRKKGARPCHVSYSSFVSLRVLSVILRSIYPQRFDAETLLSYWEIKINQSNKELNAID